MKRYSKNEKILNIIVDRVNFFKKNGIENIIKVYPEDYKYIRKGKKIIFITLSPCCNVVGKIYAIPKIINHGYYRTDDDFKMPDLEFGGCYYGKCSAVLENTSYVFAEELGLKHILWPCKTINELKEIILQRFSVSMPVKTKDDILNSPISLTSIEILGRMGFVL